MPPGRPVPPSGLTEPEAQAWNEVCDLLCPSGVVTLADQMALRMLVDSHSAWMQARVSGGAHALREARKEVARWLREFGLTPASRTNVTPSRQQPDTSKKRFFLQG